jgi:hypothetical protein
MHPVSPRPLKIVVVSTPKTGNTWVRHLLAEIYRIPMRDLAAEFEDFDWRAEGESWIGQQHFFPTPERLAVAARHKARFVTTIRHPADVFLSLFHHVHRTGEKSSSPDRPGYMGGDRGQPGTHALRFLREGFFQHLHLSLVWLREKQTLCVRYEDLCERPEQALANLCNGIAPVTEARIRQAICDCELEELRKRNPDSANFFRRGQRGAWRTELPPEFVRVFAGQEPYPEQFRELGYTLEDADPINQRAAPKALLHPFRGKTRFPNGALLMPFLKELYFDLPDDLRARLGSSLFSYQAWLNQRLTEDAARRGGGVITELAAMIHRSRPDLQATFPDIFGENRAAFVEWFVRHGLEEYSLHDSFGTAVLSPVLANYISEQMNFPLRGDGQFDNGVPFVFVLVSLFCRQGEELQRKWSADPVSVAPGSYFDWLVGPCSEDDSSDGEPKVSSLAWQLYRLRPDVQQAFPDPFGVGRMDFLRWFQTHGRAEYGLHPRLVTAAPRSGMPTSDRRRR